MTRRFHNRPRNNRRKQGGAILELIIALPILVIGIFAIVEFALLQANTQQLEYASRIGAKMASENGSLGAAVAIPPDIDDAIRRNLQEANLNTADANIRITLEHNAGAGAGGASTTLTTGTLVCPPDDEPPVPTTAEFVRVTVCMDIIAGNLTPNLLQTYGFDINGRVARQTTTYRYEAN